MTTVGIDSGCSVKPRKMLRFLILSTCVFLQLTQSGAQYRSCSISFPKDDDRTQPIVLTNGKSGFDLAIPKRGAVSLRSGEQITLFCPYTRNKLEQSNNNLTTATCVRGETLEVFSQQYQFDKLRCSQPVKGSVTATKSKCGNDRGKIINIGFKVTKNDWITLIRVCYDSNGGNALYAEHIVYGQAIASISPQRYRPNFQNDGVARGFAVNNAYKQANQKKAFTRLLGSETLASKYLTKTSFLTRGHLAPDADFLFPGQQFTTYFYVNTCPQWEAVNGGNWLRVERMVRKVAESYQKPLRIITGSHGVLSLPDINNNPQDIYLDAQGKLPVPKFLWKIVYLEDEKEGIALVALNDPFVTRLRGEDLLCTDVCDTYGWRSSGWSNMKKGFVYCCDVRELQEVVYTIPKLTIRGILKAKN